MAEGVSVVECVLEDVENIFASDEAGVVTAEGAKLGHGLILKSWDGVHTTEDPEVDELYLLRLGLLWRAVALA